MYFTQTFGMRNRDARERVKRELVSATDVGSWWWFRSCDHHHSISSIFVLTPPGFLIPPPLLQILCVHTKQYRCHDGKLSCLVFSNMLAPADLLFLSNFTFDFHRCHRYHTGSWWASPMSWTLYNRWCRVRSIYIFIAPLLLHRYWFLLRLISLVFLLFLKRNKEVSSSDGKSLRVGNRVDSPITSPPCSRLTFQLVSLFLLSFQSALRLKKKKKHPKSPGWRRGACIQSFNYNIDCCMSTRICCVRRLRAQVRRRRSIKHSILSFLPPPSLKSLFPDVLENSRRQETSSSEEPFRRL